MSKWIKNNTGGDKTWAGQLISSGAYYGIQTVEELSFMNNSTLLADIGSGDAIVAKDNSGNNDITDVNEAINYLKNNQPISIDKETPVHMYALAEAANLRARLVGIYNGTVTQNTTSNIDWQIPNTSWMGNNKQGYMDGIEYYAKDSEIGDTMKFQVIDKDGLVYPAGTILDEFGTNWGVVPNSNTTIRLYKAKLIAGMYIRIVYTSTSTSTDPHIMCNLFRHVDTSVDV